MAKFNAAKAIEPLEVDFSDRDGPKGIIPEPSNRQVEEFGQASRRAYAVASDRSEQEISRLTQEEFNEALGRLDDAGLRVFNEHLRLAISDVTSGYLSHEFLETLPYRLSQAFVAWLMDQINPEA